MYIKGWICIASHSGCVRLVSNNPSFLWWWNLNRHLAHLGFGCAFRTYGMSLPFHNSHHISNIFLRDQITPLVLFYYLHVLLCHLPFEICYKNHWDLSKSTCLIYISSRIASMVCQMSSVVCHTACGTSGGKSKGGYTFEVRQHWRLYEAASWVVWITHGPEAIASCITWTDPPIVGTSKWGNNEGLILLVFGAW